MGSSKLFQNKYVTLPLYDMFSAQIYRKCFLWCDGKNINLF